MKLHFYLNLSSLDAPEIWHLFLERRNTDVVNGITYVWSSVSVIKIKTELKQQ